MNSTLETIKETLERRNVKHFSVFFIPEEGIAVNVEGKHLLIENPNPLVAQSQLIGWLKEIRQ